MRRIVPIILSILLGALAVAGGMGFYLSKANADRERLAKHAEEAAAKAEIAQAEGRRTVDEANRKLEEARIRIEAAQAEVKALEEERALMAKATPLHAPAAAAIKSWQEAVNVSMGLSLRHPASSVALTNDERAFELAATGSNLMTDGAPYRWFLANPYDARLEGETVAGLWDVSEVLLLQQGRLLAGVVGTAPGGETVYVLRALRGGTPDLLIWMRDPLKAKDGKNLVTALSTLKFAE